jgi:hypothetical protein
MAKQVIESLVDDIDGSPADTSVTFGLDGQTYTIDLNSRHEKELRAVLATYVENARRSAAPVRTSGRGAGRATARGGTDKARNAAIRSWAADEGVELSTRGRIANSVQAAFDANDGDALRAAMGVELVEAPPARSRRRRGSAAEA